MRVRALAGLLVCACVVSLAASCRHGSKQGEGTNAQVVVDDTLPDLIGPLQAARSDVPEGTRAAWLSYEAKHASLLSGVGAVEDEPGDKLLAKLAVSPDAVLSLVKPFEQSAGAEAKVLIEAFEKRIGQLPPIILAFGVARPWRAVLRGSVSGTPAVLLNARHPELAAASTRRAVMARELFTAYHRTRVPESRSQGPLARRVFREGAAALAVRVLVADAPEQEILELPTAQLGVLRSRQALIARELLAAMDSASETEAARFFSADLKDPLLPRGAGRFISDRIFQRLARQMGSLEQPLRMAPNDFVVRGRAHLEAMARGE